MNPWPDTNTVEPAGLCDLDTCTLGRTTTTRGLAAVPPRVTTTMVPRTALGGASATMRRRDFTLCLSESPAIVTALTSMKPWPEILISSPGLATAGFTALITGGGGGVGA